MSTVYAESSAVLRWLLGDPEGPAVKAALAAAPSVVTSSLTGVEVSRTLRRGLQVGKLSSTQEATARGAYEAAARHWKVRVCDEDVLTRAAGPFPVEPVRTLDAIHLATALVHMRDVGPLEVITTDARIRDNAVAFGMVVRP